jgi:hypothetical protein
MSASIAVLVVVSLPGIAVAKGPLAAIEFSGPGFEQTLSVTEGDALLDFNPWGQEFLGERLEAEPEVTDGLIVTMYLEDASGDRRAVYRFAYYPHLAGGRIHLPGPGEADYDLNKTTILSANDGRWLEASPGWDAFYESIVRIQPPSTGSGRLR